MTLLAVTDLNPVGQLAAAVLLGTAGLYLLLPKPRGRSVAAGLFLSLAAAVAAGVFVISTFGRLTSDTVGQALFWLFAAGAVGFGVVLVAQRNPARGAIAFAFVILSTCGLFLLLAAPFLMAATLIIYAGAIIVTFLFVLMLSRTEGPTDENDRTREPLLGSLGGFAFAGLVLFALYLSSPASATDGAPRLRPAQTDAHVWQVIGEADQLRGRAKAVSDRLDNNLLGANPNLDAVRQDLRLLREQTLLLSGRGELSARNVSSIGFALYSEHLIAVEMAGTLLLVATIGAVAIAHRRREGVA